MKIVPIVNHVHSIDIVIARKKLIAAIQGARDVNGVIHPEKIERNE